MIKNPLVSWLVHTISGMAGVTISFAFIPAPYDFYVGAIWAGLVATAAFLNQSMSNVPQAAQAPEPPQQ